MKKMLDKKQAAELLGISIRSIDYFRQFGNLPCHIIGGQNGKLVRFDEDELYQWVHGKAGSDNDVKEEAQ